MILHDNHEVGLVEKYRIAPRELQAIVDSILDFANETKISEVWDHEAGRWMKI